MNAKHLKMLLLTLACAPLVSCDSSEDPQALLKMASARLEAVPSGRGTIPAEKAAASVYREVRELLQPVIDNGLEGEQAAANLIVAETQLAEAATKLREATDDQREALEKVMAVEAILQTWQVAETNRSIASTYDVSADRKKLREEISQFQASIASGHEQAEALDGELGVVNDRIQSLTEQAQVQREKAAKLDIESDAGDATTVLPLVVKAQEHSRRADALIVESELLRGSVERLVPRIDRLALRIQGDEDAMRVRVEDLDTLTESEHFHTEQARKASDQAEKIREELMLVLFGTDGLKSFREGELTQSLDKAIAALQQAEGSARKASSALRPQSQLMIARIKQASGQLLLNHAQELARLRKALERLDSIEALGGSDPRIGSSLSEALESERGAYVAAGESFQSALDAFGSAGMRGESEDLLTTLQRELAQTIQATQDHVTDLGDDPAGG